MVAGRAVVAHVTWSEEGGHIWKTRADASGTPQQLTRVGAFYHDVAWSPDGARIVGLGSPRRERVEKPQDFGLTPSADLIWIPAEGGDASLILPARGAGRPHFGPEKEPAAV